MSLEVGKEEGSLGFEDSWWCEEGFPFAEAHVTPFSKVGGCYFVGSVVIVSLYLMKLGMNVNVRPPVSDFGGS